MTFDMVYFIVVNIILLNVIFGIIIDTFADLRDKRNLRSTLLKTTCFICGQRDSRFDMNT